MRVDLQLRDNVQLVEIRYGIQKYLQDTYIRKYCNARTALERNNCAIYRHIRDEIEK